MISKLISPLEVPLFLIAFGWLAQRLEWFTDTDALPNHKTGHKMDSWLVAALLIAFVNYAQAWHNEIGATWQNRPNSALLVTLALFWLLYFAFKLQEKRRTA
ncbi:MAG TPA: hypothetical protein VN911_02200 [Candidatus Acidoferrum sp.]|nr:hypothetical protein [Candidatus Acidoferrum sp.]